MTTLFTTPLLLVALSLTAPSTIPKGSRIYIDGVIEAKEWKDAREIHLADTDEYSCRILLKHDSHNLLVAYVFDKMTDSCYMLPEIFIDTRPDGGEQWRPDDYWFHVSAQDCYAVGKREDYSHCRADYTVWQASPNYPFGESYEKITVFEIVIPMQLIQVTEHSAFGICFSLAVYPGEKRFNFPVGASEDSPTTWGNYYLK